MALVPTDAMAVPTAVRFCGGVAVAEVPGCGLEIVDRRLQRLDLRLVVGAGRGLRLATSSLTSSTAAVIAVVPWVSRDGFVSAVTEVWRSSRAWQISCLSVVVVDEPSDEPQPADDRTDQRQTPQRRVAESPRASTDRASRMSGGPAPVVEGVVCGWISLMVGSLSLGDRFASIWSLTPEGVVVDLGGWLRQLNSHPDSDQRLRESSASSLRIEM